MLTAQAGEGHRWLMGDGLVKARVHTRSDLPVTRDVVTSKALDAHAHAHTHSYTHTRQPEKKEALLMRRRGPCSESARRGLQS